jgi:hypothetical protein
MFGENMWGMFGTMHAILAIAALLFNVLIYFILRKQSKRNQIITLFLLSLLGLISLVYNFVSAEKIHEALPLNWWSISALLLPIAILTRGKRTTNILLLWSLSSIIRIAFKNVSSAEWFNLTNSLEFITDVIVAGFPILIFELDLDGIIWMLTVKLLFWILGLLLALLFGIFAIALGLFVSLFVYPFALYKDIKNPEAV